MNPSVPNMKKHNCFFVSHEKQVAVFWSQKSACGAVADWFVNCVLETPTTEEFALTRRKLRQSQHSASYEQGLQQIAKGYRSIFFCRDPYSRASSAYINKFYFHPSSGHLNSYDKLESFSKELIDDQEKIAGQYSGINFEAYLKIVARLMSGAKQINGHWDRQLPRYNKDRVKPDFVVKQESFAEDLSHVNHKLGLSSYVPKKDNQTLYPENFISSSNDLSNVNSLTIGRNKIALSKENLLTSRSKKMIQKLYREDFEYFDYTL